METKETTTTVGSPYLQNPHLDGDAFFWKAGSVGIFLSHGFTATTAEVRLAAEKFYAQGYTVAAPLLPGHGTRPEDLNQIVWQEWVRAGETELDRLFGVCEQVWIAGISMGGVLALHLASIQPKSAGILLYAPAIRLTMGFLDKLRLIIGSYFIAELPRESLDGAERWQGYPGIPLKGAVQLLRFQSATIKLLAQIEQPVLIFQGRNDVTVAQEAGIIILNSVSSKIKAHHWMENSSHAILLDEEYDEVVDLSMRFMLENSQN